MVFSDTTTKQGLIQDITFLLGNGVTLTNYSIEDRTRNLNQRQHMVWHMIFETYDGWQLVDTRRDGDVPEDEEEYVRENINLNDGVQEVFINDSINSDSDEFPLTIRLVEILYQGSTSWKRLTPITQEQFKQVGGDGAFETAGTPIYYYPSGKIVRLLPAPNWSADDSLRIYFDLPFTDFGISDSTAAPGFAKPFHRMLSIGAALDYALTHTMKDKVVYLQALWDDYEKRLTKFYAKRYWDRQPKRIGPGRDLIREYS